MKHTALILMASVAAASADPLYVFERNPDKPSYTHPGMANGVPVTIKSYGKDSIESAREYGKHLVGRHSFSESKQLIISEANRRYHGQLAMVQYFERDAAAGYDRAARGAQ
jgi:hypothetical protein